MIVRVCQGLPHSIRLTWITCSVLKRKRYGVVKNLTNGLFVLHVREHPLTPGAILKLYDKLSAFHSRRHSLACEAN